jgi:cyclase
MRIAVIDYKAGNLTSVKKALASIGADIFVPDRPEDIENVEGIIVPGVGHFGATRALYGDWRDAIVRHVAGHRPLLGICLGLQWLYDGSDEAPEVPGLGILHGRSVHLSNPQLTGNVPGTLKVPHVGWNTVVPARNSWVLAGVPSNAQAYFTHSYALPVSEGVAPVADASVATTSEGPTIFASVVERDNIVGVQFHPEKSADAGLTILRNFVERCRGDAPVRVTSLVDVATEDARTRVLVSNRVSKRIIACLDVRNGQVVKGVNFEGLRSAGDPAELARRYNSEGVDELVILDITATIEDRRALAETIRAVARELFIPLAVGGGIRTESDAAAAVDAGADKVSLNTAALADPTLITTVADRYGSQAVVVAIDAKRDGERFSVYARSGQKPVDRDAAEWAHEAEDRGAGEILLTSIDRDGTKAGFDCDLTRAVSSAVSIPVIASGGAGSLDDFVRVFNDGHADAALAASIFHFAETGISVLKKHLRSRGVPVRLTC